MEHGVVTDDQLAEVARAAFGRRRRLVVVRRLRGGSKKGVYRLTFDDGSTAIVYRWDAAEDYWPVPPTDAAADKSNPFSHASGLDLFVAAHRRLAALEIRTPQVYLADSSGRCHPADVAVVEDVPGGTLEDLFTHQPSVADAAMARLATALDVMQRHTGSGFGKIALLDSGGCSTGRSCAEVVLARALEDLADAASREARIADARGGLVDLVHELAAAVPPRAEHGLIHGELGPDHVLVDRKGQPVLIDIEGLMFFDVEWEHAFLRIRFGPHYRWLHRRGLDERRLIFYTLAMRLSLVAGPLRLLEGGFPDREAMRGIAEHNLRDALAFLA